MDTEYPTTEDDYCGCVGNQECAKCTTPMINALLADYRARNNMPQHPYYRRDLPGSVIDDLEKPPT